jgi:hypothetical protein
LGGLIYDDRGNLMSPAYSVRRGNRYRYYVGRALVRRRKEDSGSHRAAGCRTPRSRILSTWALGRRECGNLEHRNPFTRARGRLGDRHPRSRLLARHRS